MATYPVQAPLMPSLPGPVYAPGSSQPNTSPPIPLRPFSRSSTLTVTSQEKRKSAWKFEGYRAFSAWMASEDDFFIIRRFQDLNARTILWLQDRITRIEDDINRLDQMVVTSHPDDKLRNDSMRWDEKWMQQRHAHMGELSSLLQQYNQFVDSYAKVRAQPRADKRQIENIRNWLDRGAIAPQETSFIEHSEDLTSINQRTRPPLGRWLESFPQLHRSRFFRDKYANNDRQASSATFHSSNSRFDLITNTSIILGGLIMLLAPLWWLESVDKDVKKLGIMTGFICVFVGLLSTATVNRPGEVVAATAAYAAVLMVFMQVHGEGDG